MSAAGWQKPPRKGEVSAKRKHSDPCGEQMEDGYTDINGQLTSENYGKIQIMTGKRHKNSIYFTRI